MMFTKAKKQLAAGVVAAAGLAVGLVLTFAGTSGPSTWYLSPTGSDAAACSQAAPCLTLKRGYAVASTGDTVIVGCGVPVTCSYPAQTIPYTPAKPGPAVCRVAETFPDGLATSNDVSGCVTFRPATGVSASIASVRVEVPYVQLDGLTVTGSLYAGSVSGRLNLPCSANDVHDVILRNVTAPSFVLEDTSHTYLLGGSYGPLLNQASHVVGCKDSAGTYAQGGHLAIDGITMHDYRQTLSTQHMECIHYQASDNSLIVNSRFLNCAQQDISVQTNLLVSTINGLLIQNNVFDAACSHAQTGDVCAVVSGGTTTFICDHAGETLSNVTMRFNTLNGPPDFHKNQAGCSMSNVTVTGNILSGPLTAFVCTSYTNVGVTYTYNAYTNSSGAQCGATNTFGASPPTTWVNPSGYDYHLLAGSVPIDLIPAGQPYPPSDIEGTTRPQGSSADAGAYERT